MRMHKSLFMFVALLLLLKGDAAAQTVTKIVDNGADGSKVVFAILGEGYSSDDQQTFNNDVDNLMIEGLLGHDFFRDHRAAFNVYRVGLTSKASGVSKPGSPKDTALKMNFTGEWKDCYMQATASTDTLIDQAVAGIEKYPDFVMVVLNETEYGGCHPGGNRLFVTSGSGWPVVAHEYGHAIGGLFDEYWPSDATAHNGSEVINVRNCSTELDRTRLIWRQLLDPTMTIPPATVFGPGMDPTNTVGMFEGCRYKSSKIYRPAFSCRMRNIDSLFCPVCNALMRSVVSPFLPSPAPAAPVGAAPPPQQETYLNVAVRIAENGATELIKMTEVFTAESAQAEPSNKFLFEVTRGGKTISAGRVSEDAFVMRSFPDPSGKRGELVVPVKAATIVVKVPRLGLAQMLADPVGMKFYSLLPKLPTKSVETTIDPQQLNKFKEYDLLVNKFEISPDKLRRIAAATIEKDNE